MLNNNEYILFSRVFQRKIRSLGCHISKSAHIGRFLSLIVLGVQRLADRSSWFADEDRGVEKSLGDCAGGG